jgi:DNA processing protein
MLARVARAGHLNDLYNGTIPASESHEIRAKNTPLLRRGLADLSEAEARVTAELTAAEGVGAWLTTVLDRSYPNNLRQVPDLPPFLFVRGDFGAADDRAVAVVGTRAASPDGLSRARRMAAQLVQHKVTVVSGLARGIDTVAHESALAEGGRTVAVIGTGITRCYPSENAVLAERITQSGAVVSQFWPTRPPGRDTFPRRNRVTSGISQGTVVIEASRTSGAKMQARLAHEHGKRVWLIRSLVTHQEWAQRMVADGRASEVTSIDEVTRDLQQPVDHSEGREIQAALDFA